MPTRIVLSPRLIADNRARIASETRPFFKGFGVSRPLHRDLRGSALDVAQIVGRELDGSGSDVLLQAMQLRGTRDGNDPRVLGKQPGECDLSRCRLLSFCDDVQHIDQCLVRLPSFRRKARNDVAEVRTVERRVLVDLSREEAFAKRTKWNEPDSEFLEGG